MGNKKRKWWQKEVWTPIEQKAVNDYNKSLGVSDKRARAQEDDDFVYENDGYYGGGQQSSFDWGWDRKLSGGQQDSSEAGVKKSWEHSHADFNSGYEEYSRGGAWRGYEYYKAPSLSYKYVQQMANALAAQHKITIKVGTEWNVDLIKKELTYNPNSLIYGTKSELLATLMHEIGKLRYIDHPSTLKNKYLKMYGVAANSTLMVFEEVRTDFMMLKAYESASEIYESSIPAVEKQVKLYVENGRKFRDIFIQVVKNNYSDIVDPYIKNNQMGSQEVKDKLLMTFGSSSPEECEKKLREMAKYVRENGSIFEYCAEMTQLMYDLDTNVVPAYPNIKQKVEATIDAIEPSKKQQSSQELVDYLDTEVFPHVEDLLKDFSEKSDTLDEFFPKMAEEFKKAITDVIKEMIEGGQLGESASIDENGNIQIRSTSSGQTTANTPPEWFDGDYKVLRTSVMEQIKELVNKLTFIRREEMVVKYQGDQKRGKLNTRKLYKSALGSRRLFKKKLPNVDTVQSFAFSVLIDTSGSMSERNRIIHCTRALIIFAEVFKRIGIPFELIAFADGAKHIKTFDQTLDKGMEKKIGGMVKMADGGTNLNRGLDKSKIHDRPEANKVVIVLSDDGVGDIAGYDRNYFIPWAKKGIKSVGFGVECEYAMHKLCMGNSKVLTDASMLPVEFTNLLKQLIKRK